MLWLFDELLGTEDTSPEQPTTLQVTLEAEHAPGLWTDITGDVVVDPVRWSRGIYGGGPTDRVARPGQMSFSLDNTERNVAQLADYYTPGHPNAPAWWRHGTRVRLHLAFLAASRYVFLGKLRSIHPDPPIYGVRLATCVAVDWLTDFAEADAVSLPLQESATSDLLVSDLAGLADTLPANLDFDLGLEVYPFAFDDLGGSVPKAMQVAQDVVQSELGFLYIRGDAFDGETLRFEGRQARASLDPLVVFEYTDIDHDIDALVTPSTLDHIFNDVEVLTVPRRVDTSATTPLIVLDSPIEVEPGQTERLFVDYKDPENEAVYVGAKDVQSPAVGVDWMATPNEDGTGADVSSDFSVVLVAFGSRAMLEITNNGAATGYVHGVGQPGLQVRGRGLYRYREVSSRGTNQDSIDTYGRRQLPTPMLMPYQHDRQIGQGVAAFIASVHGGVFREPHRIRITADVSTVTSEVAGGGGSELTETRWWPLLALTTHVFTAGGGSPSEVVESSMSDVIGLDVGDPIAIPINEDLRTVFIHALDAELLLDGRLRVVYTLAPGDLSNFFILDDADSGQLDTGGVLGYA